MEVDYMKLLSDRISEEIEKRNWPIYIAADFCGISRSVLGKILSGKKKDIRFDTIIKISAGLEIPVSYLFKESQDLKC